VHGDTVVVGTLEPSLMGLKTREGAAYVYRRSSTGFAFDEKVQAPDKAFQDRFGRAVAVWGSTIVVGSPEDDNANGTEAGSTYVFESTPTGWLFRQKLLSPTAGDDFFFGWSVAIDDDTIAVGAVGDADDEAGAVYVYRNTAGSWLLEDTLTGDAGIFGGFGWDIGLHGDDLITSAPFASLAYGFERSQGSWFLVNRIEPLSSAAGFGASVGLSGSTAFVGSPCDGFQGMDRTGSVSIYERLPGEEWTLEEKTYEARPTANAHFGHAVRVDGDRGIIGEAVAPILPENHEIHVLQRKNSGWKEITTLTASDSFIGLNYGFVLDVDGATLVAGAPGGDGVVMGSGAAYIDVLHLPPTTYCTAKTTGAGCTPSIRSSGTPSLSGPDDFEVRARDVPQGVFGLFFWSTAERAAIPFLGGTLCVGPPLVRTRPQTSTGLPGAPCSGRFSLPFDQASMAQQGFGPGERFNGQYWLRDPESTDGTGAALTDALEVFVHP